MCEQLPAQLLGKGTVVLIRQTRTTIPFSLLGNWNILFQTIDNIKLDTFVNAIESQDTAEEEQTEKIRNRTRKNYMRKRSVSGTVS